MATHDCDVQAACIFRILLVLNFALLEQADYLKMAVIDCIVQAVEALRVLMIYSVAHWTLHDDLHDVQPDLNGTVNH